MAETIRRETDEEWIPEVERTDRNIRLPANRQFVLDLDLTGSQWRVLVDTIFPAAKSVQAIAMAIGYCRARNLDVFKRPVHIVPMYSASKENPDGTRGGMVETVWPGISELRTTAFRTGAYAGIDEVEFGPDETIEFVGATEKWVRPDDGGRSVKKTVEIKKAVTFPKWAVVTVYRMVGGARCAFRSPKIFWRESYATVGKTDVPNDMWEERPYGQIAKCAEAAALRMAFPEELGGELTAEEMQGKVISSEMAVAAFEAKSAAVEVGPEPAKPKKTEKPAQVTDQSGVGVVNTKEPAKPVKAAEHPAEKTASKPAPAKPVEKPDQAEAQAPTKTKTAALDDDDDISFTRSADDDGEEDEEEQTFPTPDQYLDLINGALESAKTINELNKSWAELDLAEKLKSYPDKNQANIIARMAQRMFDIRERKFGE